MTKESLAEKLNGRQYRHEITLREEAEAKESGLVVIFGASDDLCELRGAICDEVTTTSIFIMKDGTLLQEIDDGEEEILKKHLVSNAAHKIRAGATRIDIQWCEVPGYSWTYKTKAPCIEFDIMEDEETFCRGIVIDLKELA